MPHPRLGIKQKEAVLQSGRFGKAAQLSSPKAVTAVHEPDNKSFSDVQGRFQEVVYRAPLDEFPDPLAAAIVQSDNRAMRRLLPVVQAQAAEAGSSGSPSAA